MDKKEFVLKFLNNSGQLILDTGFRWHDAGMQRSVHIRVSGTGNDAAAVYDLVAPESMGADFTWESVD